MAEPSDLVGIHEELAALRGQLAEARRDTREEVGRLRARLEAVEGERDRLRNILDAGKGQSAVSILWGQLELIRDKLKTIVCTEGCDRGVVLLSNDGPTHYDAETKCEVYDHENFSPLGDALIELWELAGGSAHESSALTARDDELRRVREELAYLKKQWYIYPPPSHHRQKDASPAPPPPRTITEGEA